MTDDLERRLRAALSARAGRVTPDDLRPAVPPTMSAARRPAFAFVVRAVLVATSLLLVALVLLPGRTEGPKPQGPAPTSGTPCPPASGSPRVASSPCPPYTEGPDGLVGGDGP